MGERDKSAESIDIESDVSSWNSKSQSHVFQDPVTAEFYRDLYQATNYECKDYFDPELTWTQEEEKKIVRKNDWYVTFWAFIMFTGLNFDRYNIQQAVSDNLLDDLGLTTNDYNLGNTLNVVCFLAAELPSQLVSKKLGADVWIPIQMCIWSVVSLSQVWLSGRTSFLVTRALIGLFEGGFVCDMVLWMTYFYTTTELPFRVSLWYISNQLTLIISALLAAALLRIKTDSVQEGWRWLFLVEGVFTLLIGIASFFKMPSSSVHTRAWYRKDGWYTEREEKILVNKILRDDPNKGDMNNRQPIGLKELLGALLDYDLLPIYIVRYLGDIGTTPVQQYMTLLLKGLGFTTLKTNLLSIPYNVVAITVMVVTGYLSEIFKSRALMIMITPVWVVICLFPLRFWPGAQVDVWGTYALLTITLSHASIWALSVSWCSANSNSVRTRAVSSAVVNIFSQAAGITSSNIYRADDAPAYHRGNSALIGIAFGAIIACLSAREYYKWRNAQNEKKWNALSPKEQEEYLATTTDKGNKRINFRFSY